VFRRQRCAYGDRPVKITVHRAPRSADADAAIEEMWFHLLVAAIERERANSNHGRSLPPTVEAVRGSDRDLVRAADFIDRNAIDVPAPTTNDDATGTKDLPNGRARVHGVSSADDARSADCSSETNRSRARKMRKAGRRRGSTRRRP
jgi:hypothetical protein